MKIGSLNLTIQKKSNILQKYQELENPPIILSESTLKGFVLTGKFTAIEEVAHQFREKPLSETGPRTEAPAYDKMEVEHKNDGELGFALDLHNAVISGRGFHFTAADEKIIEKADTFAKDFQLRDFTNIVVPETLGYGDSFHRYKDENNFIDIEWLPISTMKAIWWDDNHISKYEFSGSSLEFYPFNEILHLSWRRIGGSPFGHGLLAPLITDRNYQVIRNNKKETRTRTSIMNIKAEMQDIGRKILSRYIYRNAFIIKDKRGDANAIKDLIKSKFKVMEAGEDPIFPMDIDIKGMNTGAKAIDWQSWEKLFRNEIITALENPAIRIFNEPGFTKANADAALDASKLLLKGFAEYLADRINNLIVRPWYESDPFITANGDKITWNDANIQFNWGPMETPELEVKDLIEMGKLATTGFPVVTAAEFRDGARMLGHIYINKVDKPEATQTMELQKTIKILHGKIQETNELKELDKEFKIRKIKLLETLEKEAKEVNDDRD